MSWKTPRMIELEEQRYRATSIRLRVERHYRKMRSFSRVAREALAERDIRAALLAEGLPVPVKLTFEEKVQRHAHFSRRDPAHVKSISDLRLRRAVISVLEGA